MRYYYFILDDSFERTGAGFIITFDVKWAKDGKTSGSGPWFTNKWETVWHKPLPFSDGSWRERVIKGGMASRRIFDSTKEDDRHRLIMGILNTDDGGFNF